MSAVAVALTGALAVALAPRVWLEALVPALAYALAVLVCTLAGTDAELPTQRARNGVSRARVARSVAALLLTGVPANVLYACAAHRALALETLRPLRVVLGCALLDTLEYWLHRAYHTKLLYARLHKQHHELKLPYSYGALYNGAEVALTAPALFLAFYAGGLAYREMLAVTALSYVCTVRQHTYAGARERAHHWLHHAESQQHNYAQPFTDVWDRLANTKRW